MHKPSQTVAATAQTDSAVSARRGRRPVACRDQSWRTKRPRLSAHTPAVRLAVSVLISITEIRPPLQPGS
jgi:hypothetical protein